MLEHAVRETIASGKTEGMSVRFRGAAEEKGQLASTQFARLFVSTPTGPWRLFSYRSAKSPKTKRAAGFSPRGVPLSERAEAYVRPGMLRPAAQTAVPGVVLALPREVIG